MLDVVNSPRIATSAARTGRVGHTQRAAKPEPGPRCSSGRLSVDSSLIDPKLPSREREGEGDAVAPAPLAEVEGCCRCLHEPRAVRRVLVESGNAEGRGDGARAGNLRRGDRAPQTFGNLARSIQRGAGEQDLKVAAADVRGDIDLPETLEEN